MILVLDKTASPLEIEQLQQRLQQLGLNSIHTPGMPKTVIITSELDDSAQQAQLLSQLPKVNNVLPLDAPYAFAASQAAPETLQIAGHTLGGDNFCVIAGPCAIESEQQIAAIAASVRQQGATILRGGAYKPRTSPYAFQGLGEIGLRYLRHAADAHAMLCVSEVMSISDLETVANYVDILQIGARNMQNFALLKAVGQLQKPVLLKRGLSATYQEWLLATEYIAAGGNTQIILCERGIRTFETYSRNTLDLAAVPILQELSHFPIIVDPSHGTGLRYAITPMARAALAVGADGVMVEVHTHPERSLSDAEQALSPQQFTVLMQQLQRLAPALDKTIGTNYAELLHQT